MRIRAPRRWCKRVCTCAAAAATVAMGTRGSRRRTVLGVAAARIYIVIAAAEKRVRLADGQVPCVCACACVFTNPPATFAAAGLAARWHPIRARFQAQDGTATLAVPSSSRRVCCCYRCRRRRCRRSPFAVPRRRDVRASWPSSYPLKISREQIWFFFSNKFLFIFPFTYTVILSRDKIRIR